MHEQETPAVGIETYDLVVGDKVGDVVFDAGSYTLEQIVERVNAESKTVLARVEDEKIKIKMLKVVMKSRSIGFSQTSTYVEPLEALRGSIREPSELPVTGNRHERRKARALVQRAATRRRIGR